MAALSDYSENKIADHTLGTAAWTMPSGVYVGLHTAAPDESGSPSNEISAGWYSRQQPATGWNAADTVTPANGATNNGQITWGNTTSSVTITHVSIWDASSGGNMLWYKAVNEPTGKFIGSGIAPKIGDGLLNVTLGGAFSNFAIPKIIDHMLGTTSWTMITTQHLGLYTSNPGADNSGTEVSGGGYARQAIDFDAAVSGIADNTAIEDFGTATADLGTVSHWGVLDASTTGNLLMFGAMTTSLLVETDDTHKFPAGNLDITVQ